MNTMQIFKPDNFRRMHPKLWFGISLMAVVMLCFLAFDSHDKRVPHTIDTRVEDPELQLDELRKSVIDL